MSNVKGKIISGSIGKIQVRKRSDVTIEIGELLMAQGPTGSQLLQVMDIAYGSQVSPQNMEMIAGMSLEDDALFEFYEPEMRHYELAHLKSLITVENHQARSSKTLPSFFGEVRTVTKDDFTFLARDKKGLFLGYLRSGSVRMEDVPISLDLAEVLSHHVLIPATTGKGKSNLMRHIIWNTLPEESCGMLVLDPHDEYYGRNELGIKDHPEKERVVYYSASDPPPGQLSLRVHISRLRPGHFAGALALSSPQQQCMTAYYQKYGDTWIENLFHEAPIHVHINEETLAVVKRKLSNVLSLSYDGTGLVGKGIFCLDSGMKTADAVADALESGKVVIVDTSQLSGSAELLVGSFFANVVFSRYRRYHQEGSLAKKPVISIVLEEAPRVLGKDVLERGSNIFSTIAREGRKFKVGLCAITQLPSLIPKQILANMNTKIILGIEMAPERQAIIESAAQDLSDDSRNIASLDKGEAIVTSNCARFATPIYVPLFQRTVEKTVNAYNVKSAPPRFAELQ